ncbi:hypothetical protein KY290_007097 [Solanum tuberosum]|uniref:RNase III domain-containing protein n=1 Tax=Solanum tuberosum TaxID=4113 RepID=A0ABQ7W4J6_SOLTU|nr:hypothetical protein KY290_007097 [Solanum tuberosum]
MISRLHTARARRWKPKRATGARRGSSCFNVSTRERRWTLEHTTTAWADSLANVLVMTPTILLSALRHNFLQTDMIKVIIFDKCHNARGKYPYASIMMVYTCGSEAVLVEYIRLSNLKLKIYKHVDIPSTLSKSLEHDLKRLKEKHECSISKSNMCYKSAESAKRRLSKLHSAFLFCLSEMGVCLAFKAAEFLSQEETDFFSWGELDVCTQTIVRDFSLDASKVFSACLPSGPHWSIGGDIQANTDAGYLSSKVHCLLETLLEYRNLKDLRCIIFVERIITDIVLRSLLNELLPKLSGWRTEYTAGHASVVNIIVATSFLEEGLDVQSCNLIIRFDPSATVCSYIQSLGRARMQNSDFLLMWEMMQQESLRHASIPCSPLDDEMYDEPCDKVESTGAIVTLNSSVSLLYFYCSRLPSDRLWYFNEEFMTSSDKMYSNIKQKIRSKRVADVVEALIGAYLSSGGEVAALSLMKWLGMNIDFVDAPIQRHFPLNAEKLVNVRYFESLLHYKFHDPSLLVEAFTHGSYMLPEIPRCYQRLEFLGDAVLDYVITAHLYFKYPGLSPRLITDLRSASVNNECYAQSAIKASLHKHILHVSPDLQRQICNTIKDFKNLDLVSTFGWVSLVVDIGFWSKV